LHTSGANFVNEVATPGTPTFCGGVDYVELFNSGPNLVDIGGYSLTDPTHIFTIPSLTILAAGAFKTYRRGFPESFDFGLSATAERLQFFDSGENNIFSSSIYAQGSSTSSFQRLPNDFYGYGHPSPNAANAVPAAKNARVTLTAKTCSVVKA
jgi:hypothetical protein